MNVLNKVKSGFDHKSLRSRYIYIALATFMLVSLIVVIAEVSVKKAAEKYQSEISSQFIIKNEIESFISRNDSIKSLVLEFIVLPEKENYERLEDALWEYEKNFLSLESVIEDYNLNDELGFEPVLLKLRQDVDVMKSVIGNLSEVRNSADENFPFTNIMVDVLVENNKKLLGAASEAVSLLESTSSTKENREAIKYLEEIKYYWVRISAEYRLMVTIRFGVFIDDWKIAYNQVKNNIENYKKVINANVEKLEELDGNGQLEFEASNSLEVIKEAMKGSFRSYESAIEIVESPAWRQDIMLWESRVAPGFERINYTINDLRMVLQNYQLKTMNGLSDVSRKLAVSLWIIIGLGVLITLMGYLIFDRKILKPIAYVTRALVKQSEGKDVDLTVHSSTREISDLVESYSQMYKQVKLSKANLEKLVSERTSSLETSKLELEGTLKSLRKTKQSELEAEKANQAKTLFLANMSHEIRTPMNVILGYTQILQHDKDLNESQRSSLDAIKRSGTHLLMLINNVLDISKIESGETDFQPIDFDLIKLLNDLFTMFKVRADGKGIDWKVNCNFDNDVLAINTDKGKLNQVLINLVGNAIKFTDTGGVNLDVTRTGKHQYLFEVIDSGPGIAVEAQSSIFDKFSQEKNGLVKGGTGLGLSISKTQVEALGGELDLESALGKGSRFYFSLDIPDAVSEINTGNEIRMYLPDGCRIKAMVVDDISGNRDVLSRMLKIMGVDVIEAESGAASIVIAEEFSPDLVFMDYHMPDMNGLEALHEIRNILGDTFKAVVVTAHAFDHDISRFQTFDVSMVIKKPFREDEIFRCVSQLLSIELIPESVVNETHSDKAKINTDIYTHGLPESLLEKLLKAIEYSEITMIENIAKEIAEKGSVYRSFAFKITEFANNFDIVSLQKMAKYINDNR